MRFGVGVVNAVAESPTRIPPVMLLPILLVLSLAVVTVIKTLDWRWQYKAKLVW